MRHRLLGIVIGSRATAVAIIFHYYCYRSAFPTMPPPPGLAFFLLLPPTDIVTTCGVLRRRIEITRVNLTFDLISENRSLPSLRYVETSAIKKFRELIRGSFITQGGMARAILHVGSIHLGRFLSEFRWTAGPSRGPGSNLIAKNSLCASEKLPSFRSLYTRPSLPCGGLTRVNKPPASYLAGVDAARLCVGTQTKGGKPVSSGAPERREQPFYSIPGGKRVARFVYDGNVVLVDAATFCNRVATRCGRCWR
ncbi:hypothetical protein ALC62_04055 [Cyphomyrmex costatus]|uniref:Uncharacterized protein n=1 Tax=Cyphomyrmex costatus TaxID=456900 RepID=A0A195CWY4_9HYME|nr:hypothetical protein ALC62_04055 [Cyphomyrmex costatus]